MAEGSSLSLRMLTVTSLEKLRLLVVQQQEYRKKIALAEAQRTSNISNINGFDAEGIYDSSDYTTIYNLVGHVDKRDKDDLLKRTVAAVFIMKLLKLGGLYFNSSLEEKELSECECANVRETAEDLRYCCDDMLVCHTLLTHILSLPCNTHSVSAAFLNATDSSSSSVVDIGYNVYGMLSLSNHSCDRNGFRSVYKNAVCVLRAARFIGKGEEICDNYGAIFRQSDKSNRQNELKRQFFFKCECVACREDWHLYLCNCNKCNFEKGNIFTRSMQPNYNLKCPRYPECTGIMTVARDACDTCKCRFRQESYHLFSEAEAAVMNKKMTSVKDVLEVVKVLDMKVLQAVMCVSRSRVTDEIQQRIKEYLYFVSRYCYLIDIFFDVQDAFEYCINMKEYCIVQPE